jgi:DNA-directed RNA polymerase sigma subunit (sigma70/sigma32)
MQISWEQLSRYWAKLSPEHRYVLWLRLGMDIGKPRTLDEVSILIPKERTPEHIGKTQTHNLEKEALTILQEAINE